MKKYQKDNLWTAILFILIMVVVLAVRLWTAYMKWKVYANPDVGFWEFFVYAILLK